MKQYENRLRSTKGITLIALVVTIIVLLILASITISVIFSDNGIIKKAQEAANKMNEATTDEQQKLNDLYNELNNLIQDGGSYNNNTVDGVVIPEGFYYVGGSKETGIVISDNEEDYNRGDSYEVATALKGNQFVWVPVENYGTTDFDNSGLTYTEDIDSNVTEENEAIKNSIEKYKGFYIGRYETGMENGTTVVKQGKEVAQVGLDQAIEASRNLYNISSVGSTLIRGGQWDATMNFISDNFNIKDSSQYGNYANYIKDSTNNITISKSIETRLPIVRTTYEKMNSNTKLAAWGELIIESELSSSEFISPSYESSKRVTLSTKLGAGSDPAYIRLKYEIDDPDNIIKNKSEFINSKELPEDCLDTESDVFNWDVPDIKTNVNNTKEDKEATINITVDALQKANVVLPPEGGWSDYVAKNYRSINKNNIYIKPVNYSNITDENLKLAYMLDSNRLQIKVISISNKPKTTGYSEDWKTNNIYDMAGNNYEWTVEKSDSSYVIRGGQYYNTGNVDYIAKRTLEDKQNTYGYRVVLYLK